MIFTAACGLIGACVLWLERNDTTEQIGDVKLKAGFWTGVILLLGACLIRQHHVELWRFALAFGLLWLVITASHNILLSSPDKQKITAPRDLLQRFLFYVFAKSVGDPVGNPLYIVFSAIRYALPVSVMGFTLENEWLIIAGPVCSVAMLPLNSSDFYKVLRAAFVGFILGAALAAGV